VKPQQMYKVTSLRVCGLFTRLSSHFMHR